MLSFVRRCVSFSRARVLAVLEVVRHFRVKLVRRLLLRPRRVTRPASTAASLACRRRRFRLRLGLPIRNDEYQPLQTFDANLHHTLAQRLRAWNLGRTSGIENNLNLKSLDRPIYISTAVAAYPHRLPIDKEPIQLFGRIASRLRLAEDDRCNASAGAVLVVREHNPLDRACSLGEIFL